MKKLTISIVSWNTRDQLKQCLESVFDSLDGIDAQVVVVDNASDDFSADMVEEAFPQALLIRSETNLGFARANNVAYARSSSEYFLLLNSDTVVLPGALGRIVSFLDASPDVGATAPKLLNPDGSLQRSCSSFPSPLTEFFDAIYLSKLLPGNRLFGRYAMSYWDFSEAREVDFAGGGCLLLRRSALEQVGLLDEDYFMYTEEADLCYRLKKAGWKIIFVPDAEVMHMGGQSTRQMPVRMAVELPVSRYRFVRKFYGPVQAILFKAAVALGGMCRIAAWAPFWLVGSRRRQDAGLRLSVQGRLLKWAITGGRE